MSTSNHNILLPHKDDVEEGLNGDHHKIRDYRKLAICSIICGLSCVGIMSLIYSVKTREYKKTSNVKKAKEHSRKTLYWAIGAFVAGVCFIVFFILLMGLLSYVLTFID